MSTIGTAPYPGPLPEELTKLEATPVPAVAPSIQTKQESTETVLQGLGLAPTAEALAKLATLLEPPPPSDPWILTQRTLMQKPTPTLAPAGVTPVPATTTGRAGR